MVLKVHNQKRHICRDGCEWWCGACEWVQAQLSKVSTIDFPCFIQKRAIVIQWTINGKGDTSLSHPTSRHICRQPRRAHYRENFQIQEKTLLLSEFCDHLRRDATSYPEFFWLKRCFFRIFSKNSKKISKKFNSSIVNSLKWCHATSWKFRPVYCDMVLFYFDGTCCF